MITKRRKKKRERRNSEWQLPTIEQISRLLKITWENDKIMCLAFLLGLCGGLSRSQILMLRGRDLANQKIIPPGNTNRMQAQPMIVEWSPLLTAWMALFPSFESDEIVIPLPLTRYPWRFQNFFKTASIPYVNNSGLVKAYWAFKLWGGPRAEARDRQRSSLVSAQEYARNLSAFLCPVSDSWLDAFETDLFPEVVLGRSPTACTKSEFLQFIIISTVRKANGQFALSGDTHSNYEKT